MRHRTILALLLSLALVLGVGARVAPATVSAATITKGVCEYYYGPFSTTATQQILNAPPEMLVANTPGGSYGSSCPVTTLRSAGIKVFSYISVGRLEEYKWSSSSPANDYTTVMSHIRSVAAEGCYGVYFDESLTDANKVGLYSWAGHTMRDITGLAHSLGLKVIVGQGGPYFNTNLWEIADYILSEEWYGDNGTYPAPQVAEIEHPERCIVIGYGGVTSAAVAAARTNAALSKGFGYAYHCPGLGTMASWFGTYMSQVKAPATPYTVTTSVSGSGTTNPAPGTYGPYSIGRGFSIEAIPSSGYVFDHWSGSISGTANPVNLQINSNMALQAVFTQGSGGGTLSRYEGQTTSNIQDNIGMSNWRGQTFTPATTHNITKIRLPILRPNYTSGDVVVSVRRTDTNGLPTGNDLATGSIPCSLLYIPWGQEWYDIGLGAGCQLVAGTKYALIIRAPGAASNLYYWVNTASAYSRGEVIFSYSSGTTWYKGGSYAGWDMVFEEWGTQGTAAATAATPLSVSTTSLASGTVGLVYNTVLAAVGGTATYTWSISAGSLPTGLSLAPATGVISGTPTVAATSNFTIRVTDSVGATATRALSLAIDAAPTTSVQSVATTAVRYEGYTSSNAQDNLMGVSWKGQTFTPVTAHTVTKIRLPIIKPSDVSGSVVVSIRGTDANGLPTGSDLATGSIPCSSLSISWSQKWYDIGLGAGCQLAAGTKYALIIRAPSAASNLYHWVNTAGAYSRGEVIYSHNSGNAWAKGGSYAGWDMVFEEWGTQGTPATATLALTTSTSVQSGTTAAVRYEGYTSSNAQDNLMGVSWKGQTFTPVTAHTVTKIRLPIIKPSDVSGSVVVSIRGTDANGLPTGSDLATGSIPCSSLSISWSQKWYDIGLGAGCQLAAGTKYALIIRAPSAASNLYHWVNTAGAYSRGEVIYSHNSGNAWAKGGSYAGWDMVFEEWGN